MSDDSTVEARPHVPRPPHPPHGDTAQAPKDRPHGSVPSPPRRTRRGPGPVTLLVLPGLLTLAAVAGVLALTGGLPVDGSPDAGSGQSAAGGVNETYGPWLRKAAGACTVVTPALLAAQIDQLSGWRDDTGASGEQGIAGFTDGEWRSWGRDDDGNGKSSPRDPADAVMALGRQDCSLAQQVTELRTEGTVNGDLVDLTLAAYAVGTDAVKRAGRVPAGALTYLAEVKGLLPRYGAFDKEPQSDTGPAGGPVLTAPLTALTVTSPYGSRRHPLTGVTKLHTGVDFAAPLGTPVTAARDGRVVFAAMTKAYGNRVVVDHGTIEGKRLETTYSHLSALDVRVGQSVRTGTLVGRAGSTGLSTGPHLHFEVVYDGYYADPGPWLGAGG
ncbi:M23 family metallopeptidase [Streptomyces sp. NPDC002553]|uniref:M23 family metallopeptidase n=1 Tax=Streptomyces sp. NPDC002553 TaxID=3154417 RepID=UPI00331A5A71